LAQSVISRSIKSGKRAILLETTHFSFHFLFRVKIQPFHLREIVMIADSFKIRTIANMEVALERACQALSNGRECHDARRFIASRILKSAERGDETLGALTQAGLKAVMELEAGRRAERIGADRPNCTPRPAGNRSINP